MIGSNKEKIYRDGVRCQSAKSDRDPHRVCPSKLSKKELEELYFSLMDTNLELKRTVNAQQESIKVLTTRVNRLMTAQKSSIKDNTCCAPTKAIVLEQKDTIADLKKANDRMSERIRILNMRLCSAKQFLKRCPSHANARCIKCCMAPPASLKNSAVSMINSKRSESEHNPLSSQIQGADKEPISSRTVETETEEGEKENESSTLCKENKCRTLIEELKQKIIDLQEESSKYQSEYAGRISRLEQEMCVLQADNERVRRERAAATLSLQQKNQREQQLAAKLRAADTQCNDITSQLLIEKSKVAELKTRVKASDSGSLAAKALEKIQKLDTDESVTNERANRSPLTTLPATELDDATKASDTLFTASESGKRDSSDVSCKLSQQTGREVSCTSLIATPDSPDKGKHSDDSGYNDNARSADDETLAKINKELAKKITDLQEQLDILRIASAGLKTPQPAKVSEATNVEIKADESTKQDKSCSRDAKNVGNKSMGSERKKDQSPDHPTKDILRANEMWANLAEEGAQQKEEKIQFINLYKERTDRDSSGSSPTRLASPDKDTIKEKVKKRTETKLKTHDKDNSKNELVDKIVDTKSIDKSAQGKIVFNPQADISCSSKVVDTFKRDIPMQDNFRHERITPDSFRRDIATRSDVKSDSKTQIDYEDPNRNVKTQDIKCNAKTQDDLKSISKVKDFGVKIQENNIIRPREDDRRNSSGQSKDIYKYMENRKGRRNSKTETKEQGATSLQDIKNQSDEDSAASDSIHSPVELCEQSVRLCSCARAPRRAVSVFRSCSGTLRFRTTDAGDAFRKCRHCGTQHARGMGNDHTRDCGTDQTRDCGTDQTRDCGTDQTRDCATDHTRDCGADRTRNCGADTTLSGEQTRNYGAETSSSRAPITCDAKNNALSPKLGRRRVSIAHYCAPHDDTDLDLSHLSDLPHEMDDKSPRDCNALSPGEQRTTPTYTDTYTEPSSEMPTLSEGEMPVNAGRRRSLGEAKDEAVEVKADVVSVSQKMEEALHAIGEELSRCRQLLQNQRELDQSKQTKEASTNCPSHVALRHSPANPQLAPATTAPNKGTFTLHIGTLVLSDEAVILSRDKSLLLTWKFFEQSVAMTRMRSGRVVLFDFTTEYDAEMDDRFMDYLKYEEMTIIICELNKQNSPFASCTLPLRDVLLNANHRVDMSLAMTMGPDMRRSMAMHSVESLVKSDEVGVLDLWCMLRKRGSASEQRHAMAPQERMDDCSDEYRLSASGGEHFKPSSPISPEPQDTASVRGDPLLQPSQLLDDSSLAKYSIRPNSVITNEVPTNIRCSGEMKRALDRNAEQNNLQPITGLAKLEEDVMSTQNPQSIRSASWTKFIRRQSRSQKKRRKSGGKFSDAFETIKNSWKPHNREFKFNTPTPSYTYIEEPPELGESSKDAGSKKSVTISPRYSKLGWEQPQQEAEKTHELPKETIEITVQWLALNEECSAMTDPSVQRLYVAYSLLGRSGADLETPISLPKPKSYIDKCVFNFKKTINIKQCDMAPLGHMGRCRSNDLPKHDPKDCIVFTVISEPAEDPLGLASCEDIGYAYLYLGDVLSCSAGSDSYTEVVAVRAALRDDVVVGVLCVQLDGLEVVRRAKLVALSNSFKY